MLVFFIIIIIVIIVNIVNLINICIYITRVRTPKTLKGKTGRKIGNHTTRRGLTPEARKALSKVKNTREKFIASRELNRKYLMLRQFIISNKIRNTDLNKKMRAIYLTMNSSSPDYNTIVNELDEAYRLAKSLKK